MPEFSSVTSALTDRPRGAISVRDASNNTYNYVGEETKICVQAGVGFTDVSLGGGYTTGADENWEFAEWKTQVLATNFTNNPQTIVMGSPNFADLTSAFKARHISVVRDHVVLANTFDGVDGEVPFRVRWSAFNDETDYTVSPTTGSDYRDLTAGGWIQKVVGGETGMIISEESTHRMQWVGAPVWFDLDEVTPGIGTYSPGSVASLGGTTYFWSEHGIVGLTNYGTGVTYPAAGRVDKFIRKDLDYANRGRISSVIDPQGGRVFWAYPGPSNVGGTPNRLLCYDWTLDKWALLDIEVELILRAASVGYTLDGLDAVSASIDALPASLDSQLWAGGAANLAAIDAAFTLGYFTGSAMTATIETRESEILEGQRCELKGFRSLVDGGTVTVRVGTRNRQVDDVAFGPQLAMNATTGGFTTRRNARFHRFELTLSGDWEDAIGVAVDKSDIRPAGLR